MTTRLERFRADPSMVRVGIRALGVNWYARVYPRDEPGAGIAAVGDTAPKAVDAALILAAKERMPGIDLGMQWAYPHPFAVTELQDLPETHHGPCRPQS